MQPNSQTGGLGGIPPFCATLKREKADATELASWGVGGGIPPLLYNIKERNEWKRNRIRKLGGWGDTPFSLYNSFHIYYLLFIIYYHYYNNDN